jgi:hypothetical protein
VPEAFFHGLSKRYYLRGICLYCHNDAKVYIVGEFLLQRAKKSRATFDLQAGSEKMESGKKVEFVHKVQIFLGVLSSVLDCEDGILRGIRSMSGKFSDYAARGFAGNRADAGDFMQIQAGHAGVACQVMLGVSREDKCNTATSSEMV